MNFNETGGQKVKSGGISVQNRKNAKNHPFQLLQAIAPKLLGLQCPSFAHKYSSVFLMNNMLQKRCKISDNDSKKVGGFRLGVACGNGG